MLPLLHTATRPYEFHWSAHPDVVVLCLVLLVAYAYAMTVLRGSISDAGRVRRSQAALFVSGVLVLYAAAGTPIHDLSEGYLFSVHMFQHLLFTMVAAPLLLLGTPSWLWRALLRRRGVLPVARVLAHPIVAFGVFNAVLVITHLPPVVDLALRQHAFHFFVHAVLVATAMQMWWPILSPVPELPRLSYPFQMAYLFVQSVLPSVVASFVTFADSVVYSFYADAPRTWGISAMEDQQLAGGVMKLLGSLILWGFIAYAFFRWYQQETASEQEPRWEEVEEELDRLGLTSRR